MTILAALRKTVMQQVAPNKKTMAHIDQFLDYMTAHPGAATRYCASDMVLTMHSDAPYLSASKAGSKVGCHFWGVAPKRW